MTDTADGRFEGYAILELMGHRKLAGRLSEQEIAGQAFVRIDIPGPDADIDIATQFYSAAAIYAITPTTEELARAVATGYQPQPVTRWELQAIEERTGSRASDAVDPLDSAEPDYGAEDLDPDDEAPF